MARPRKLYVLSPRTIEELRAKIPVIKLVNKLVRHATETEKSKMDASAVQAAAILLRKVLPDLAAVEHSGTVDMKPASELTDNELATIAARGSEATPAPAIDPSKFN